MRVLYSSMFFLVSATIIMAREANLKAIIANPRAFHGKQVTTTGLAGVAGNGIYLFPDYDSAVQSERDTHRAAYIPDTLGSFNTDDNRYWFEVTGVVNAYKHGPSRENACEIEITGTRKLYREKRILWPEDIGVFFNTTSTPVIVDSEARSGGAAGVVVASGKAAPVKVIPRGEITVSRFSARDSSQAKLFTTVLHYPERKPNEPSERRYRFVIHEHRLEFAGRDRAH